MSNGARIKDEVVAAKLGERNICVRSGIFCAQPLVDYRLKLTGATRASFHVYNTQEDVDALVAALKEISQRKGGN